MYPFIHSVRVVPETASSSSHYINLEPRDSKVKFPIRLTKVKLDYYGRSPREILSKPKDILAYILTLAHENKVLQETVLFLENLGIQVEKTEIPDNVGIDHASFIRFKGDPQAIGRFLANLAKWIIENGYSIVVTDDAELKPESAHNQLNDIFGGVYRVGVNGDYFVLRDEFYYHVMKVAFVEKPEPTAPDNVEMKITQKCYNKCAFCYERSNPKGKHGNIDFNYFNQLYTVSSGVTTVVLGGGNPLLHPDLKSIVHNLKIRGFDVAVTVRDSDAVKSPVFEFVWQNADYIGVSYTNNSKFEAFVDRMIELEKKFPSKTSFKRDKHVVIHLIDGIHKEEDLQSIVNTLFNDKTSASLLSVNYYLLVLGFKQKGRAKHMKVTNTLTVDALLRFRDSVYYLIPVAGDTLFYEQVLKGNEHRLNLNKWFFVGEDGETSYYFDAVRKRIAISSNETRTYPTQGHYTTDFQLIRRIKNQKDQRT